MPRYRGRFAPSPTGALHFGSLIAALASYCDARAAGGEWLVRIEDVDAPRTRAGAADAILSALDAYGFEWDGPVTRQSERIALYESALEQLVNDGNAFACTCTRKALSLASLGVGGEPVYPGTCRDAEPSTRSRFAWRARVGHEKVGFRDRVQGWREQCLDTDVGDFVVKRSDGLFAYQLAVVVDDAQQGISHVVRGADLLESTPRQILLQKNLGFATPDYLHHTIAVDASGNKLSKSTHASRLPDAPLPALLAAWRFLDQPQPTHAPGSVAEFWQWAHARWDVQSLSADATTPVSSEIAGAV